MLYVYRPLAPRWLRTKHPPYPDLHNYALSHYEKIRISPNIASCAEKNPEPSFFIGTIAILKSLFQKVFSLWPYMITQ